MQIYISQNIIKNQRAGEPATYDFDRLEIDVSACAKYIDEDEEILDYNPFEDGNNSVLAEYIKELIEKFYEDNDYIRRYGEIQRWSMELEFLFFED